MSLCVCCLVIMPVTKLSAGVADFAFRRYLSFILLNAPAGRMNNLPTADLSPTTLNHYFWKDRHARSQQLHGCNGCEDFEQTHIEWISFHQVVIIFSSIFDFFPTFLVDCAIQIGNTYVKKIFSGITLLPEIIHQLDDLKISVQQFVDIYNRNYNSLQSLRKPEGWIMKWMRSYESFHITLFIK